jgi:hypothetical protein
MVTGEETAKAFLGVGRIALFDRAGVAGFGKDLRACARSFWAYAIAAPAMLLLIGLEVSNAQPEAPYLMATGEVISDIVQAAGFPLLLLPVLRRLKRVERWAWFVTGYNWFQAAQTIAFVTLLGVLWDLPSTGIRGLILRGAQVYFLVLEAFLADAILEIGAWRAAGIVLLDIALGLAASGLVDWAAGLG